MLIKLRAGNDMQFWRQFMHFVISNFRLQFSAMSLDILGGQALYPLNLYRVFLRYWRIFSLVEMYTSYIPIELSFIVNRKATQKSFSALNCVQNTMVFSKMSYRISNSYGSMPQLESRTLKVLVETIFNHVNVMATLPKTNLILKESFITNLEAATIISIVNSTP